MEMRKLGASDLEVSRLGVGAMTWGQSKYLGRSNDLAPGDVEEAYQTSLDAGINFFDTAEIYKFGGSERRLGGYGWRQCGLLYRSCCFRRWRSHRHEHGETAPWR